MTMNDLRILYFLPDGFGGHGGISQFNKDLLTALCALPHVREVMALPRRATHEIGALPAKLTYDTSPLDSKVRYGLRSLHHILRDGRFDLIVCTHINLQPLAALARKVTGAPSILVLHGIEAWQPPRSIIARHCADQADWFAAVSRLTLDRFRSWARVPPERGVVFPCCVELERFTPGPASPDIVRRYGLAGKRPILSLARLAGIERSKGLDQMLNAMPGILARAPDAVYVIAGTGDDRDRLEAEARRLGVSEQVRFTGYVPDADKVDLYRSAQAFVLAGQGEGFGIVLLEAMACGIPVVASRSDGSYEAVRGGEFGIAVDPDNRAELTAGVLAALTRPVGVRPSGLDCFSYAAFARRAAALVEQAVDLRTTGWRRRAPAGTSRS